MPERVGHDFLHAADDRMRPFMVCDRQIGGQGEMHFGVGNPRNQRGECLREVRVSCSLKELTASRTSLRSSFVSD